MSSLCLCSTNCPLVVVLAPTAREERKVNIFQFNTLLVALGPMNMLFRNIKSLFMSTPGFLPDINCDRLHNVMQYAQVYTYCVTYQPLMNPPGVVVSWIGDDRTVNHCPIIRVPSIHVRRCQLNRLQDSFSPIRRNLCGG